MLNELQLGGEAPCVCERPWERLTMGLLKSRTEEMGPVFSVAKD